ncbi:COMM domain-containing protein 4 isoform 1-T1 [Glossina fuscipes fuscipes]
MKFRFCGDGDCPDWVLGEIIFSLSVMEAENLELLAELVAKKILGEDFDESLVKSLIPPILHDGKSAIACIHLLLNNAARHSVTESVFNEEIQQLGLPKQHAEAICRVLSNHATAIRQRLIDKAFRIKSPIAIKLSAESSKERNFDICISVAVNELSAVQYLPSVDAGINCSTFELKISQELVDGLSQNSTHVINIDNSQLRALLEELKYARDVMAKYEIQNKG